MVLGIAEHLEFSLLTVVEGSLQEIVHARSAHLGAMGQLLCQGHILHLAYLQHIGILQMAGHQLPLAHLEGDGDKFLQNQPPAHNGHHGQQDSKGQQDTHLPQRRGQVAGGSQARPLGHHHMGIPGIVIENSPDPAALLLGIRQIPEGLIVSVHLPEPSPEHPARPEKQKGIRQGRRQQQPGEAPRPPYLPPGGPQAGACKEGVQPGRPHPEFLPQSPAGPGVVEIDLAVPADDRCLHPVRPERAQTDQDRTQGSCRHQPAQHGHVPARPDPACRRQQAADQHRPRQIQETYLAWPSRGEGLRIAQLLLGKAPLPLFLSQLPIAHHLRQGTQKAGSQEPEGPERQADGGIGNQKEQGGHQGHDQNHPLHPPAVARLQSLDLFPGNPILRNPDSKEHVPPALSLSPHHQKNNHTGRI